jgi:hypothetical protein
MNNTIINLTYKGVPYTLEYNRAIVKALESSGFDIDDFMSKPMINIELAFTGAFKKNHKNVSQTLINEIFESCPNKAMLVEQLQKMIAETYESLLGEPTEDNEGNATWEVVDLSPKKSQK